MKKRQWIILSVPAGILVFAFVLSQFFASLKEAPEVKKAPVSKKYVETKAVAYNDIKTYISAFGRVETAQSLDLLSEVSGRMFQGNIRLKEGQNFKKGTLLFYVDDTEASLTLKSQKSNFLRDIAAILPDLKIDYNDNFSNWETYFSSIDIEKNLPELPELKSDKEKTFLATKGIYSTYYTIKSAEERLRKHRYYAPFDGSISEVNMESGAFINPGTKIGTIIRTGLHELKVAVETRDIPWVQVGAPAEIYSSETQQKWTGEVARISDFVNQNTQSVDVYLTIDPGKQKIYDGQFLQSAIPASTVTDGMLIPRNVLYNTNEVYVVEDTLLKVKQVFVHRTMEENVVISGLNEGEDLVVEPLVNAHNNMVVFKSEKKDINMELSSSAGSN
ncbi:MAG: efflux transporter periplasmic adaptor subunit [Flammeovirgaceae bacterium]|nr:efflux transporter periplasmic adaptor subunit [Flammeovirgaceae bacterium]MBE63015.1 efflux transporter periplasmic adaptor subunit [Flammeovirgaceae bacterium]HCX20345.1 efflux transporter periplasmic adaptor subunit [Cytophagales bacterium]|tara:strand:- start:1680 stop:2846 length:1167 start_codon:yes stop_codon:yes gene_type:complete